MKNMMKLFFNLALFMSLLLLELFEDLASFELAVVSLDENCNFDNAGCVYVTVEFVDFVVIQVLKIVDFLIKLYAELNVFHTVDVSNMVNHVFNIKHLLIIVLLKIIEYLFELVRLRSYIDQILLTHADQNIMEVVLGVIAIQLQPKSITVHLP